MNLRRVLAVAALAATILATGALALDRLFPPDLSRYHARSSETVDANGRLLRAFTTADGKWRLKTTVDDVDPVYLALLKAYEDRRFDDHWGIDPLAAAPAPGQRRGASAHWPPPAPPASGWRAAASSRAPRRSPCRPPACWSRGGAGFSPRRSSRRARCSSSGATPSARGWRST